MASIYQHARSNNWSVKFRYGGQQFCKSLKTDKEKEANRLKAQIERTIADLERGRLVLPEDADLWAFVLSDGKLAAKPTAPQHAVTLSELWDAYFASQVGQKEENTLTCERTHRRNIERVIGGDMAVKSITGTTVQNYIAERAKSQRAGRTIGTQTIKKEVATLRMLLYRAERLTGQKPTADMREMFRALAYPKSKEKPGFMTWAEIEAQIQRTTPEPKVRKELWDRLFLDKEQVSEFLDWAEGRKNKQPVPYFFPLVAAAAHTGARLSELIRSQIGDWDFENRVVVLREKKKSQKSETFRRVDLSARLIGVLQNWLAKHHPGGESMFCGEDLRALRGQCLQGLFRDAVKNTKWNNLRGYHVLRHSFASNLAHAGVDERVVDELMGHQTEAMRRRYRHLFPDQRKSAVASVFG